MLLYFKSSSFFSGVMMIAIHGRDAKAVVLVEDGGDGLDAYKMLTGPYLYDLTPLRVIRPDALASKAIRIAINWQTQLTKQGLAGLRAMLSASGSPQEVDEAMNTAIDVLDLLLPEQYKLSLDELTVWLLRKNGGDSRAAIQELRERRDLGLETANDLVVGALSKN